MPNCQGYHHDNAHCGAMLMSLTQCLVTFEIMKKNTILKSSIGGVLLSMLFVTNSAYSADINANNKGKIFGDFRLRYESVDQNNALADADALTIRSRLGYKTASVNGFSALIEAEVNVELVDDFSVPPAGVRPGQFSVIADPETEEIDQAYVQYSKQGVTAKLGRQVIALDGHRFVGHVGWRQDRQTFDALSVNFKPNKKIALHASYINKRNRIFAEESDLDSKDILLNSSFKTDVGKITAYAYLLEVDNNTNNALDTFGVSVKGKQKLDNMSLLYGAEYASQEINNQFDTDYVFIEGGVAFSAVTTKVAYEVLGSDQGQKGFATPLATLHKFNGWADTFLGTPNQGLEDLNVSVSGKLAGGKWLFSYHDYTADVSLASSDDLGDELNVSYTRKFGKTFSGGVKLANYSAGNPIFNKVDTDKFWLWASAKF